MEIMKYFLFKGIIKKYLWINNINDSKNLITFALSSVQEWNEEIISYSF